MTANEVRIGNLLSVGNYDVKVVEIHHLGVQVCDLEETQDTWELFSDRIKPIPLTEEWLLKFGFTICENEAWYEKKIPTLGILVSCNLHGRFCVEHTDEIVTIRDCCYKIHELQNLYFALVREELTFKSE